MDRINIHFNGSTWLTSVFSIERCSEIERANRILLERMTSILAGPATHNQLPSHTVKTQGGRRDLFSSRKRGATALPTTSGARALLMAGIHNPAVGSVAALDNYVGSNPVQPLEAEQNSPSKTEVPQAIEGALASEAATSVPGVQVNAASHQSLQMV